jgi:hypothetical protein
MNRPLVALLSVTALVMTGCGSPAPTPPTGPARPTIGQWHDLVYHERLGATILVNGGPERATGADEALELWSWDGSSWRRRTGGGPAGADAPRWRNFAATAYDSDRGVLIIHGGLQGRGALLPETWEWDGTNWRSSTARDRVGARGRPWPTTRRARSLCCSAGSARTRSTATRGRGREFLATARGRGAEPARTGADGVRPGPPQRRALRRARHRVGSGGGGGHLDLERAGLESRGGGSRPPGRGSTRRARSTPDSDGS